MNKKTIGLILKIVIPVIIIAAAALAVVINMRLKAAKAIPDNAVGNTSGNINNRGRFCEADGYVYFSNPYDSQKLYRMKSDGSAPECLSNLSAEFINVYGDDIYFYQTSDVGTEVFGLGSQYGICHSDISGKKGTSFIDKTICNSLILYGNNLYYQSYNADDGLRLCKASVRDYAKNEISKKEVYVSCPINGYFYCYNTENGYYLSAYDMNTDTMQLAPGNVRVYNVTLDGNYLYFMNIDESYRIYRMGLNSGGRLEKLVDTKVDTFNVYGNNLFYQKSSETSPQLIHLNLATGDETVVAEGNFKWINCTSEFTYFYDFDDNFKIYSVPTSGGVSSIFRLP